MSQENVELHRRLVEAFNARDLVAFLKYCHPSIEFHSTIAAADGVVYLGHDGLRAWHRDLQETWSDLRAEPEAYFDLGHRTLTFNVWKGRGRHSGATVAMPVAQIARWRDGLIVHFRGYVHREDAMEELGVNEESLQRIAP